VARVRSNVVAVHGDLIVERDPQRPSGRLLRQADMDASYIDLADARHLEFDYMRWARLILRSFGPRQVLHVGGAACALPRALLAEDPASRHEVFEVDDHVLQVAREHLGLRRQPGLRVRCEDGRAAIAKRPDGSAEAIVIDAFIGARVPRHLVTQEAVADYARVVPLTLVNVVDTAGWRDARAVAAALGGAYPHVAALGPGSRRGGNIVLFGATTQPRHRELETLAAADAAPARLLHAADLAGGAAWRDEPTPNA